LLWPGVQPQEGGAALCLIDYTRGLHRAGGAGSTPSISSGRTATRESSYGKRLYRMGHKVEHLLAKLKDRRPIATRYGRCAHAFLSAVLLTATLNLF